MKNHPLYISHNRHINNNGTSVDPIGDTTAYYHSGLTYGYHTQNIYIKEKSLSITAFINCSTQPTFKSTKDSLIEKVMYRELYQQ